MTARAATAGGSARRLERAPDEVVGVAVFYQDLVARDAAEAGVRAPALDELSRKLPYRIDDARPVLAVGRPAGARARRVRLHAIDLGGARAGDANATGSDIAYDVVTAPVSAPCNAAPARASTR
jgi:hypothetical protein